MNSRHQATNYIPTLDGWRCLAILLVVFCHTWMWLGLGTDRLSRILHYPGIAIHIARSGGAGVGVFFCLSGFLITRRLIDEGLDLRHFYVRRAFRILPAALVYLAFVGALGASGVLPVSSQEIIAALLFFRNFLGRNAWFTGHFWSLSVEEQYYLVWPAILAVAGGRLSRMIGLIAIVATVIWRQANWPVEGLVYFHTDMRLDAIFCGSVMALSWPTLSRVIPKLPVMLFPAGVVCFFVTDVWSGELQGYADTIQAILVCFLIASNVATPERLFSRLLENRLVRQAGKMSYSVYLWQQVFLRPGFATGARWQLPLRLVGIVVFAAISYYVVELPMIAVGRSLLEPALKTETKMPAETPIST